MAYVYLVLTSQVQEKSSILRNSASAEYHKKEHALSKVDFSIGADIYMLPNSLNIRWDDKRI